MDMMVREKRLTRRQGNEIVMDEQAMHLLLDRLAGYEDSHLTPEELQAMTPKTFGEKLMFLRNQTEYTQKEFSKVLGISQGTLSAYENNLRTPTYRILKQIASRCSISLDWLCW